MPVCPPRSVEAIIKQIGVNSGQEVMACTYFCPCSVNPSRHPSVDDIKDLMVYLKIGTLLFCQYLQYLSHMPFVSVLMFCFFCRLLFCRPAETLSGGLPHNPPL